MFRKLVLRVMLALAACAAMLGGAHAQQAATKGPRVLMLYDRAYGTDYEKLGFAYAIMLRNLLGPLRCAVDLQPVQQLQRGHDEHATTRPSISAPIYDNPLPAAFLADAA